MQRGGSGAERVFEDESAGEIHGSISSKLSFIETVRRFTLDGIVPGSERREKELKCRKKQLFAQAHANLSFILQSSDEC